MVKSNIMTIRIITTNIKEFLETLDARSKAAYAFCIHDIIQAPVTNKTSHAKFLQRQRWSFRGRPWPRGHILKSLALASKVKSLALASRPQVLDNWLSSARGQHYFLIC